jgi:ABC-2 type transport system permease protein
MNRESRETGRAEALGASVHRLWAIARKELLHIVRDGRSLFMVFISPAFTLMMLSYLFTWDVEHFSLGLFDEDKSVLSRQYVASLTEDGTFDLRQEVQGYGEANRALLDGQVQGVLVIPPGLMDKVNGGEPGQVQAILDGTNPNAARQMLSQLIGQTQDFVLKLLGTTQDALSELMPIDVRTRIWYNPNLRALHSMVPGLIAVVMCMPAFSIATSMTKEKEVGTMEGLLATPVRGAEVLVGKLLAYVACGLGSVVPVLVVAIIWFGVPFRGNVVVFLVLTADFLLGVLCLSLFLANFLSTQQAAMVVLFLVLFIPSIYLSGLIDPVDRTSISAQLQANLLPTTHYVVISRGVFLKGVGWAALWPSALILAVMAAAYLALGAKLFRERLG